MKRSEKKAIAESIYKIEKSNDDNNISENMRKIGELVKYCSIEDLLEIDDIIVNEFFKKEN